MFPTPLEQAMAQFEGFGIPGTIATRQNNPGNISYGPFALQHGATGVGSQNIAMFPDVQSGLKAMDDLIAHYSSQGYNLGQLIGAWSPSNAPGNTPQSTQNYTNFVSQRTGASPESPLTDLLKSGAWIGNPGGMIGQSVAQGKNPVKEFASSTVADFFATYFGRIMIGLVGLIMIGGGLFLFKPTQDIITKSAKGIALA